jgi:hypothetical protein
LASSTKLKKSDTEPLQVWKTPKPASPPISEDSPKTYAWRKMTVLFDAGAVKFLKCPRVTFRTPWAPSRFVADAKWPVGRWAQLLTTNNVRHSSTLRDVIFSERRKGASGRKITTRLDRVTRGMTSTIGGFFRYGFREARFFNAS